MGVFRFLRRPADAEADVAPAPPEPDEAPAPPEPPVAWTAQLSTATLDEAARLRLVDDLALLGSAWAVALLRRAYEEEQAPQVRAHIAAALAACGEPIATT